MSQMNNNIKVELSSPERKFVKVYHDFLRNELLTVEEKMVFIVLKSFIDFSKDNGGTQGKAYPTVETVCKLSSLSKPRAIKAIKKLEEKKIIKKTRRGLTKSNIYLLSDYATMWTCDTEEEMAAVADNKGKKPSTDETAEEYITKLERMGYEVVVKKKEVKEKGLTSGSDQTTDVSTYTTNLYNDTTDDPKSQEDCSMSDADADALLNRLWELYPVKKGKGQISATQKKKLLKIGYEEMERAIHRYKKYVASVDYLHYQNGSTFFNSGYVDYLDANYDPKIEPRPKNSRKKNTFNDYPTREYDFNAIERSMFDQ